MRLTENWEPPTSCALAWAVAEDLGSLVGKRAEVERDMDMPLALRRASREDGGCCCCCRGCNVSVGDVDRDCDGDADDDGIASTGEDERGGGPERTEEAEDDGAVISVLPSSVRWPSMGKAPTFSTSFPNISSSTWSVISSAMRSVSGLSWGLASMDDAPVSLLVDAGGRGPPGKKCESSVEEG